MASIEDLSADQRAVLELVLRRGRSYDEIAKLLSIDRAGVRQRALTALEALGPPTRVPAERRALICDYLLGALPEAVAEEVRAHLSQSAAERAWARAVSSELQGVSETPLPEVPADPGTRGSNEAPIAPRAARGERPHTSSRRGGALLLGASGLIVVAVILAVLLTGSSKPHVTRPSHRASVTGASGATGTTGVQLVAQIKLTAPSGGGSPIGGAEVVRFQGKTGLVLIAQGLRANTKHPPNFYAVWLSNTPTDSHLLGFAAAVGSNGLLRTGGSLTSSASRYQKLLLTLETSPTPKTPGTIALEGNINLR